MVSLATDGETFGHHQRFADMALGAFVSTVGRRADARMEGFGAVLARTPPPDSRWSWWSGAPGRASTG
ncbi:MAG: hypothetical protein GWM92_19700 [Gemmatimonadetes bacterium]|nr:hypothetical protein [Gemmatimonadota bacterium]NIR81045.1 hypothetical protein [Gemmatimonadota bacterium]NIT89863.1 hypothetical protein [Gemmatimonadota bacterium]NIU33662.1 hypothetical protein [Gemmatimonadota bacterium]NIU37905.1 hypothetical protein [Gemmatimonadota bacterium]